MNSPKLILSRYTVEFALDELVESLCRVSLDPRDPRRAHLQQLAQPVQTSLTMLRKSFKTNNFDKIPLK